MKSMTKQIEGEELFVGIDLLLHRFIGGVFVVSRNAPLSNNCKW